MVIQHNVLAMNASRQLGIVKGSVATSTEKLSSGYRINRSADDAAGLSISEKMRHQIHGLDRGASNIEEGIGYCQTADGALQEMEEMCQRINELAVQAANGTNSETDRAYIDEEIQQLKEEIDRICITTKYNDEYIFRCEDKIKDEKQGYYLLNFSGSPNDVQIYNETYDAVTGAVTYGGVVDNSVRYAWSTISAGMYDATTGLFQEGEYSFATQDGTTLKFICEDGTKPPEVIREFYMVASENGINIDGEEIPWKKVVDASGKSLNPGNIEQTTYSFFHNGVKISFMPDIEDDFQDVIAKLSYTRWQSRYQMPHEETAVQVVKNNSKAYIQNKSQVEEALKGNTDFLGYEYTLRAGDGSSGSDGLWLEKNGATVGTSLTTWAGVDMADWGDLSDDIDENRSPDYKYSYAPTGNNETSVDFQYRVINEISKDSLIDALDGMTFKANGAIQTDNEGKVDYTATDRVVGMSIVRNTLEYTVEQEYELGRDFSVEQDVFGDSQLEYDAATDKFSVRFAGTDIGGNAVEYLYESSPVTTTINTLANQIYDSGIQDYLGLIRLRYLEGASNPTQLNLSDLIDGKLTGSGSSTYLKETVTVDPADPNWKRTSGYNTPVTEKTFASSKIDFSGFGVDYNLSDLIGLGFNTTCQTCSNHYSVQFSSPAATNATWTSFTAEDGNTYQYAKKQSGQHYTLYLNIDSMQGKVTNGVELSNAVLDAINASKFEFHFTQYATKRDESVLYLYDNRPNYVSGGVSTATSATFEPYSYTFNPIATVNVNLYDSVNTKDYLYLRYQYNYTDLLDSSNLTLTVVDDANGKYVETAAGQYELYTGASSQNGLRRVNVTGVDYNQTKDDVKDYIENTLLANIAASSRVQLQSTEYASVKMTTAVNSNKAMVTDFDTPTQVLDEAISKVKEKVPKEYLKIQCSANSQDLLYIEKQRLSVYRLGMYKLNTRTQGAATNAIDLVSNAIQKLNTVRSCFGAYQNRLEHSYAINLNTHENTTYAESGIRDTDMAEEMVAYSNSNVLQQAGQSMLAQANQSNQGILQLLQ